MKYHEKEILEEIQKYIEGTYGQHYVGKDEFQIQDLFHSVGIAEPFCTASAMKYLTRFGKKNGRNRADLLKAAHYIVLLMHFSADTDGEYLNEEEPQLEFLSEDPFTTLFKHTCGTGLDPANPCPACKQESTERRKSLRNNPA